MQNSILLPSTLQELDIDTKELSNRIKQSSSQQVLKIFQSDDFTPEILIHYFMATFNEPGPHQYLTNRLYHMPNKFVEYYIPQFVYMIIKIGSQSMETFLESLCSTNIANYFKIAWCLNAYSQDERNDQKQYKKLEFFQRRLEKEMVNGAIKFKRENILNTMQNSDFQECIIINNLEIIKQCKEKEFRSQYIFLLDRFLIQMIQLSLTLKSIQDDQRKQYLLDYIGKGNRAIQRMRNMNRDLSYYWGIIIPFARDHETKAASNLIVHICEESAACFNTKTRVPYRILIETISIQELEEKFKNLPLDKPQENADGEDFIQMIPPNNLEEIMKQMTHEKQTDTIYNQLLKYESQSSSFRDFDDLNDQSSPQKSKERRSNSWSDQEVSPVNMDKNQKKSKDAEDGLEEFKQLNLSSHGSSKKLIIMNSQNVMTPVKLKKMERNYSEKIQIKKQGPWGEDWNDKFDRIKLQSPFKDFESYKIRAIMVKGGDDLRQELLAMQVIQKMNEIFRQAQLNVYLKPYEIIVTSENSGILEFVSNSISMDGLKKYLKKQKLTLHDFYKAHFENEYQQAQQNFVESLAGYSLLCYFLQIKDRHNGNILVDNQGHLIHIDFGFILSISPGNMGFERAPFKMTNDYLEIMEGQNSRLFDYFRRLMFSGFMEIRKYCASIFQIIEIMMEQSNFNCFKYFNFTKLKQRFLLHETDLKCREYVEKLIQQSIDDNRTFYYDKFQYMTNGIEP